MNRAEPETLGRVNGRAGAKRPVAPVLPAWVRGQAVNVMRHATALRPFRREEFGMGPPPPARHTSAPLTISSAL